MYMGRWRSIHIYLYIYIYIMLLSRWPARDRVISPGLDTLEHCVLQWDTADQWSDQISYMGVSENSVANDPMVLLIIIPTKWLFHWGYTPFSDIPISGFWWMVPQNSDFQHRNSVTVWHSPHLKVLRKSANSRNQKPEVIPFEEDTLWWTNIASENGPFIVDFPIKNGDFPLLC